MSDKGKDHKGGNVKWFFIILGCFVCASPILGLLIDVFVIFRPSPDSHGHGAPFLTILFPVFAIIIAVVATIVFGVINLIVRASARKSQGRSYNESLHYEYLKILQKCDGAQTPAMILHEIDKNAGRCSVRCIYIYQNGFVENFVNNGVYAPVPTAESIHASGASHCQTVHVITGGEFENMWDIGHCVKC